MIKVERSRVPVPAVYDTREMFGERARLEKFFRLAPAKRAQQDYEFKHSLYRAPSILAALRQLFGDKCAFCESKLEAALDKLGHFRPLQHAVNLDGQSERDCYGWLAYEWANLYLICPVCERAKSTRFPILGQRARVGAKGKTLLNEQPLLLDPCDDDPAEHLYFEEDGQVVGLTERGNHTIEILTLNRAPLIEARRAEARLLQSQYAVWSGATRSVMQAELLTEDRPYLALRRQLFNRWQEAAEARLLWQAAAESQRLVQTDHPKVRAAKHQAEQRTKQKEKHSVEHGSQQTYFGSASRFIERVEIRNFKAIEHLDLHFPTPTGEGEAWLALVGENGVGKSSVLQAIALTLMGQRHCDSLRLDARRFVRKQARGGAGEVKVWLTSMPTPLVLRFDRRSPRFRVEPQEAKVLLLGYGSTRLLPRQTTEAASAEKYIRIRNLFVPTAPLSDAAQWLGQLPPKQFNAAARALKDLLLVEAEARFSRRHGRVTVALQDGALELSALSDGFQSVLAYSADIMRALLERWDDLASAEGIVLIDELEVHLHPRWKIELVTRLRRAFPKAMFIVTTHDPLCLKGLRAGEIVALRRRDESSEVYAVTALPPLEELRADEILTSPYFALRSTRGVVPQAERRYLELLAKQATLTAAETHELAALRETVRQLHSGAETEAERRAEEMLEQMAASSPAAPRRGRGLARPQAEAKAAALAEASTDVTEPVLRAQLKKQLARLFKDTKGTQGGRNDPR